MRRDFLKVLLLCIIIGMTLACSHSKKEGDLDSWTGRPVNILETHKVFSALPREEHRVLGTNYRLINYYQKYLVETGASHCLGNDFTYDHVIIDSELCPAREYQEKQCTHQFLIKDNKVQSYRVLGDDCYTECSFRPEGTCPK